jgi:PAS domain S-box-containing protein
MTKNNINISEYHNICDIEDSNLGGENKLHKMIGNSVNAFFLIDHNEKSIYINRSFSRIFGYTIDDLKNKVLKEIIPKYEKKRFVEILKKTQKGINVLTEIEIFKKGGNIIQTELNLILLPDGIVCGECRDISKLSEIDNALNQERRRLHTIIDLLPTIVYVKDIDCKKVVSNKADFMNIGFETEVEVLGKTDVELFSDPIGKRGYDDDKKVIRTGKPIINKEEYFLDEKGFKRWFLTSKIPLYDNNEKIKGLIGIAHDITERKTFEEKLLHSCVFSESILKTIPFGMHIVDETGSILFQNDIFKRIFSEGALGKKCWDVLRDDRTQSSDCPLFKGISINETDSFESNGILENRIFAISYTGMIYQNKKALLEIFQDITERKVAEEEIKNARDKAEESDRLKTAFLHNISHEIRTPMNAIVGFSSLLGEPDVDAHSKQSYIDIIMQSSNNLLGIITDIMDFSNIEANLIKITKSEINLNSKIKSLWNQFIPRANLRGIQLICETGILDSDLLIVTDGTKLSQIISNLICNAIKFTEKGYVKVSYTLKDNFIEFCVSDTGIGIPQKYHEKVFERFYQVDETFSRFHEGTGLGLAISKAYVEILGGKIWLSSQPDQGSSFFFTIPLERDVNKSENTDKNDVGEASISLVNKTILVAEDIDSNFKLISYFLSKTNATIIRAINGMEAVRESLTNKNIDLIIMDIKMPIMDGFSATKQIREKDAHIPIIAQSAYVSDSDIAIQSGCSGFISKPFDKKGLLKIICDFI